MKQGDKEVRSADRRNVTKPKGKDNKIVTVPSFSLENMTPARIILLLVYDCLIYYIVLMFNHRYYVGGEK